VAFSQWQLIELGLCHTSADFEVVCKLVVTMLDMKFRRPLSDAIIIQTNMSSFDFVVTRTKYLPLQFVHADVALVRREADHDLWQVAISMQAVSGAPWNATLAVRGMQYSPEQQDCKSFTEQVVDRNLLISNRTRTLVSYWTAPVHENTVNAIITLRRAAVGMNVAVVRNVTSAREQCPGRSAPLVRTVGRVLGTTGLGAPAIGRMEALTDAKHTVGYGNPGRLFTFAAYREDATEVHLRTLLAVYVEAAGVIYNVTHYRDGRPGFRSSFRTWCRAQPKCQYEYLSAHHSQTHAIIRVDCSNQHTARTWISLHVGTDNDAGHTHAACATGGIIFLVATAHHVSWARTSSYYTHLWPQFEFQVIRT